MYLQNFQGNFLQKLSVPLLLVWPPRRPPAAAAARAAQYRALPASALSLHAAAPADPPAACEARVASERELQNFRLSEHLFDYSEYVRPLLPPQLA
jgi:hypothetical protein